ncbi:MAG TPA: polysaccharide deacetylase family protein [Solirubrobacteraceae bacterium]|jgi:peptidoglycan/xylan/chitin deacetylase (PgdA/CDA1 family)|nr:polysaccharide deacetylase family protein [Solirubrobacteraceae bacterium]
MRRGLVAVAVLALALSACGGTSPHRAITTTTAPPGAATAPLRTTATRRKRRSLLLRNARPQADWRPYTGPVPILVYHALGPAPRGAPFPGLYVSYRDFKDEMAWLHTHGYQAVTLNEVMKAWFHGGTLPDKPIVITFDNGYPEQVTFAPHVMAKYGWPGVLNEITENHLHRRQLWPIIHRGWEVDSHSLTHPNLTTEDPAELRAQLVDSREYLRKTFHIPVNSFCYPSSRYSAAVIAAVKAAGYSNALTENAGYASSSDPYLLDRFEIESGVPGLAHDLLAYQPPGYGSSS